MLIGAVLILTWLILLLRYPAKALPVSLAAAVGLGLVAAWVVWEDSRDTRRLERLEVRLNYAPEQCPVGKPLLVLINNGNKVPLGNVFYIGDQLCILNSIITNCSENFSGVITA